MDIILNTFLGPSGLSRAGQEFFRCMTGAGIKVIPQWFRINQSDLSFVRKDLADKMIACSQLSHLEDSEHIQFVIGTPNNINIYKGRKLGVGSMVQEANYLNSEQLNSMQFLDVVMAPSTFCRNVYLNSGVNPRKVFHVPYPLDTSRWNPSVEATSKKEGVFRFLFMNTPYERKGIDVLIRAWLSEFRKDEPVELVIKTYQENKRVVPDQLLRRVAAKSGLSFAKSAKIILIDAPLNDVELPSFMKSFDALVSPHRSEGFGMNPWYAMALGIPVICTNYAGTMDFCNTDSAWLVNVESMVHPTEEEILSFPQFRGISWADPSESDLRRQMRACYNDAKAREQKAAIGAKLVADKYADAQIISALKEALNSADKEAWEKLTAQTSIQRMSLPDRFQSRDIGVDMIEI